MDPLTHAVSGASLALARRATLREVVLLALVAMAPDLDIVLRFISDIAYLEHHRGITHSLLLVPLWAWLLWRLVRPRADRLSVLWIGLALLLHIALDCITSFGTMLFAPIFRTRVALDWVFIVDPLLTFPALLLCLLGAFFARVRKAFGMAAGLWLACYIAAAGWLHAKALAIAQSQGNGAQAIALPLPFSPFRWRLVIDEGTHWRIAALDLAPSFAGSAAWFPQRFVRRYTPADLAPANALRWRQLPKPDWRRWPDTPIVRFYRWFARLPVVIAADAGRVVVGDLRFGAAERIDAPFQLHWARATKTAQFVWRPESNMPSP